MKRSKRIDIYWVAIAAVIALSGCLCVPSAFAQATGGLTLAQAQEALTQAQAAYAQAVEGAKTEVKAIPTCQHLTDAELTNCRHDATAQRTAINKRLGDAEKVVVKAESEVNRQKDDAAKAARANSAPKSK